MNLFFSENQVIFTLIPLTMTRILTYLRLMKWIWIENKSVNSSYTESGAVEEITDFDLPPYLGWMEEELRSNNNA